MAQQLKMTKTTWQSSTADFAPAPPGESRWIIRQWAASVFAPLCESMMSFTKPEVHNILHCCQRRTEPQPQVTCTLLQKISWSSDMSFRDMRADRHTDRQTQKETNLQTRISQYFAPSRWRSRLKQAVQYEVWVSRGRIRLINLHNPVVAVTGF